MKPKPIVPQPNSIRVRVIVLCPSGPFAVGRVPARRQDDQKRIGAAAFLRSWSTRVACEGMTVAGLLTLLGKLSPSDLDALEITTGRRVRPVLAEHNGWLAKSASGPRITIVEIGQRLALYGSHKVGTLPTISIETTCTGKRGTRQRPLGRWGIGLSPLSVSRDAEIVIARTGAVVDWRPRIRTKMRFKLELTVGELVTAVISELSVFGSPAERERFKADLDRQAAGIESGRIKTIPLDDLMKKWKSGARKERAEEERVAAALWRARHRGEKDPAPAE
jgi:hypothetical protein